MLLVNAMQTVAI